MSRVEAAAADRLPWLQDEPQQAPARRRRKGFIPWAVAAVIMVAGAGVWMGSRSAPEQAPPGSHRAQPSTTVPLPAAREAEPIVQVPQKAELEPVPIREVRAAPAREIRIAPPKNVSKESVAPAPEAPKPELAPVAPVAAPVRAPLQPWNPRVASGAAGRLVQIGAFGSIHQAKQGWWHMARAYPAMRRLPAVVRPTRNSKGRVFYRFQVGTTSQAHSEVLCQRMEAIRFSCAVVGLPWKAKVER